MTNLEREKRELIDKIEGKKHTPGPWSVHLSQSPNSSFVYGHDGLTVASIGLVYSPGENHIDIEHANAQLIAAAPDLLEALKAANKALENLTGEGHVNNVKAQVRETILKAEGQLTKTP